MVEGKRAVVRGATAVAIALLLTLSAVASAETVNADLDGDGIKERVTANSGETGVDLHVSATLSGGGSVERRFESAFVFEPIVELVANVDGRAGDELFLHRAHISTFDTTTILTVVDRRLVVARSFRVNAGTSDGYAMGFRCARVGGRPGVVSYAFARDAADGRWNRVATRHRWQDGRLQRVGRAHRSTVGTPSRAETGRGCPAGRRPSAGRAASLRSPQVVLGERDNGLFSGIGVPRPRTIHSAAGFESFVRLRWHRWGTRRAVATGRFLAARTSPGPGVHVRLTATERGVHSDCDDGRAYRQLRIKVEGQRAVRRTLCQ